MAACSQLSYYLVTAVQIDGSFVYYLSILMIETEFIGGGGPIPFLPMEKCVFFHFSHGEKVYGKRGK